MSIVQKIKRFYRYTTIYGFNRTLIKSFGHLRLNIPIWLYFAFPRYLRTGKKVGIIGCGHHSFSSISYFIISNSNAKLLWAYDTNINSSKSLSKNFGIKYWELKQIKDLETNLVYIVSNHSTHTKYAIEYLKKGCDVYIEKPISINENQLKELSEVVESSENHVYVGYNRPHSPAIKLVKKTVENSNTPFTLSAYIIGHMLNKDHWYRDPKEGTRIVSNAGHWIDLATHIMFWKEDIPKRLHISIAYSNSNTPSDNISINITTSNNDLISIVFSTRNEPYEGVNETINFQQDNINAKIDDFRKIKIWNKDKILNKKFYPKNNGHKEAVLQPLSKIEPRKWKEIKISTQLMLFIEKMVQNLDSEGIFEIRN